MNKIRTIFFGTPDFALPSLQGLLDNENFEIITVITQTDKKVGRKRILTPPPVKVLAEKNHIPVLQPQKLKDIKEEIADLNPDICIVVAYGKIIRKNILDIPKYGFINVHGSILPLYRGAAVIQAPILNGDDKTGISIIKMDEGLDTGPILKVEKINLAGNETAEIVHDKLSILGGQILPQVVFQYINQDIESEEQTGMSFYVKTLEKEDGKILWKKEAESIERQIRAFNPWPNTYTHLRIKKEESRNIKIIKVKNKIIKTNKHTIGEVFLHNNELAIQCGTDAIAVEELQIEGKKKANTKEFLNGQPNFIGQILT